MTDEREAIQRTLTVLRRQIKRSGCGTSEILSKLDKISEQTNRLNDKYYQIYKELYGITPMSKEEFRETRKL